MVTNYFAEPPQKREAGTNSSDPKPPQTTSSKTYNLSQTATLASLMMDTPFDSVPFVYDGRDRIILPKQFTPGEYCIGCVNAFVPWKHSS